MIRGCQNCMCHGNSGGASPYACISIQSSELGSIGSLTEPDHPTLPYWYGVTSGAYGLHVQYVYEDEGGGTYQQRIVMEQASGTFTDGEALRRTSMSGGAGSAILLSGYTVQTVGNGGADQTDVDCETGFDMLNPASSPAVEFTQIPNFDTMTTAPETYYFRTVSDESATAVDWGTVVTGQTTGTTGIFVSWHVTELNPGIRIREILAGPNTTGFAPGETITIEGVGDIDLNNPHDQTMVA